MWNAEYDVIVIGSGFAGLAAAIEAKKRDVSVAVLEKMKIPGGNSAISGGLFAAAGSPLQKQEGIKDSPDLLFEDMLKAGMGLNHPKLTRIVAEQSGDVLRWAVQELGVQFKERLNHLGGHSVPRTYIAAQASGSGIISPMLARCRQAGIPIQLGTFMRRLLQDQEGRVIGVEVQENYNFPNPAGGQLKRLRARKGVVLACGGFSRDVAFRIRQDPRLGDNIDSTNQAGATAEGLIAALKIGATPIHLSWIQLGPWTSADEAGWGVGSMFSILAGFPYGIMVDAANGTRFVNELSDRKLRIDAMLTKDRTPVAIVDSEGVRFAPTLPQCLKRGVVREFATLEELAAANGIPPAALKETVRSYNASFASGRDKEFGKPLNGDLKPLTHPPFYAIRLLPKVHHCMGGIQIDTRAQVLELETGQPISGLFAAGEITGGIHGASRLGSCAIPECLIFGRIAGQNAATP